MGNLSAYHSLNRDRLLLILRIYIFLGFRVSGVRNQVSGVGCRVCGVRFENSTVFAFLFPDT